MKNSTTPGGVKIQLLNLLLFVLFFFAITSAQAQNCSVNAGIDETICVTDQLFLNGSFTEALQNGTDL